AEVKNP
ncbi:hypothetical protein ACN38_g3098, partial [Penicillium nordicum]